MDKDALRKKAMSRKAKTTLKKLYGKIEETIIVFEAATIEDEKKGANRWGIVKSGCPLCDEYREQLCLGCIFNSYHRKVDGGKIYQAVVGCKTVLNSYWPDATFNETAVWAFKTKADAKRCRNWCLDTLKSGLKLLNDAMEGTYLHKT